MQLQPTTVILPKRFNRFTVRGLAAISLGLILYGCGENRVVQCNKVVTVANKTKDLAAPKDATGFAPLADSLEQIRTEVQAIAVQDASLKEIQTQLTAMYGDVAIALKSQATALEAKDQDAVDKAKQELETAASKENDIVDRLNALCSQ